MRPLALLLAAFLVAGCDRVPIEPVRTELLVAEPDLGVVQLQPGFVLRLTPDGPTRPLTVRIRSKELDFDSTAGAYIYERELSRGLNVFPLSVTDEDGTEERDTLYAVYLPIEQVPLVGAEAGAAREGAAAAPYGEGEALVTGGADETGAALATAAVVGLVGSQLRSADVPLGTARAGHTATAVAGGVLLLGGAATLAPGSPADFVRQAEWVGPDRTARPVEVVGGEGGPARAGHVARAVEADGETYVYLMGGRVPSGSGVAVASTVDVYRVVAEAEGPLRLERLSPAGGAAGFVALADAALAPFGAGGATAFGLADGAAATVALRWTRPGTPTYPFSLRVGAGAALATPRTAAAAVDLGDGLALVAGGRDLQGATLGSLELYAPAADRTFRFPDGIRLAVPRSNHVATILGDGRILLIGGRPASGGPVVAAEAFRL